MKLWEYLKEKMAPYAERIAFAGSGTTYGKLLSFEKGKKGKGRLTMCGGKTKEERAMRIFKCLARGETAVLWKKGQEDMFFEKVKRGGQVCGEAAFLTFDESDSLKENALTDEKILCQLEGISSYFDVKGLKSIAIAGEPTDPAVLTGEFLYALLNGLTIYFYEGPVLPQRLARFLKENGIEVFCGTPTLYLALKRCVSEKYFPVKAAVIGGERLTKNAALSIAESFSRTDFYGVYGPTEHGFQASVLLPEDFAERAGSIGKPVGRTKMRIQEGEIQIKSPVAAGERARGKEKLCRGWLHTGIAGHTDAEGYYYPDGEYPDGREEKIVRAGFNIFPAEIERVLRTFPGIEDCRAFGIDDELYGQRICVRIKGSVTLPELRRYAAEKLPPYLVPHEYRLNGRFEDDFEERPKRGGRE